MANRGALIPAPITDKSLGELGMAQRKTKKVTCEDCYFGRNLLCALELPEPCATFRQFERAEEVAQIGRAHV